VTLENWYVLPEGQVDELQPGPYSFIYLDESGQTIFEQSFDISFTYDYGSGSGATDRAPFVFTIPYVAGTAKINVSYNGAILTEKVVSAHSPTIQVITPNGGEVFRDQFMIQWVAQDTDNDLLTYTLLFSRDLGLNWEVIAGNLTSTEFPWDVSRLPAGSEYLIKVIVTDGFNTADDASDAAFNIVRNTFIPLIIR